MKGIIMKKTMIAVMLLMPTLAQAETVKLSVGGLVCAYCVQGIEKKFRELDAVEDIAFDLDNAQVTLTTKGQGDVSDQAIKDVISYGGYTLNSIVRE